jgi:hypothetical protein
MGETGISTVEEAFAAAKAEMGEGSQPGSSTVETVGQSTETAPDQPGTNPDTQALLDSLTEQPAVTGDPTELGSEAWWQQNVELDGEQIQLKDLRDGNLRHSDYTKKTQALADERRALTEAAKFHQDFTENPEEFAKALAVKYGWVDESQTGPIMEVDLPGIFTAEQLDAKVNELVNERLANDPLMHEAKVIDAQRQIDEEFGRLEKELHGTISADLRQSIIAEAIERQVWDLEILLRARMATQLDRQRTSDNLARSASSRPQSGGGLGSNPDANNASAPQTVEEAWLAAKAEAAAS